MPRFAVFRSSVPGTDPDRPEDFSGRTLVFVWGRFCIECTIAWRRT